MLENRLLETLQLFCITELICEQIRDLLKSKVKNFVNPWTSTHMDKVKSQM